MRAKPDKGIAFHWPEDGSHEPAKQRTYRLEGTDQWFRVIAVVPHRGGFDVIACRVSELPRLLRRKGGYVNNSARAMRSPLSVGSGLDNLGEMDEIPAMRPAIEPEAVDHKTGERFATEGRLKTADAIDRAAAALDDFRIAFKELRQEHPDLRRARAGKELSRATRALDTARQSLSGPRPPLG
jgi:hypothetical protein